MVEPDPILNIPSTETLNHQLGWPNNTLWQTMTGGFSSHKHWRVEHPKATYHVTQYATTRPGYQHVAELAKHAGSLGLAPSVIQTLESEHVIVYDHLQNGLKPSAWLSDQAIITQLAENLIKLHKQAWPCRQALSPLRFLCEKRDSLEDFAKAMSRPWLAEITAPKIDTLVWVHGDCHPHNIWVAKSCQFLDWEHSGLSSPWEDIAKLAEFLSQAMQQHLVEAYFGHLPMDWRQTLEKWRRLHTLQGALWAWSCAGKPSHQESPHQVVLPMEYWRHQFIEQSFKRSAENWHQLCLSFIYDLASSPASD